MKAGTSRRCMLALAAMLTLGMGAGQAEDTASCNDAATQLELNACHANALGISDRRLNELYRTVEGRLAGNSDARDLLIEAQRRWIAFRDAECAFEASGAQGGSIQPMIRSLCLTSLTDARSEDLQRLLSCEEGDTTCAIPPG